MNFSKKLVLIIDATIDPGDLVRRLFAELGIVEPVVGGMNPFRSWYSARFNDRRMGVSAAINTRRMATAPDDLFEAVGIRTLVGWLDVDIYIYKVADFDEMAPTAVRMVGAILRMAPGDAILLDDFGTYPGLVRRDGQILVNTPSWHWTEADLEPLGLPYKFQHLPKRPGDGFDDDPDSDTDDQEGDSCD